MDASWYQTWRGLHSLGLLVFVIAHIFNIYAAFRVKTLDSPDGARRLLDRSRTALLVSYIGLLVTLVAGLLAGISGGWFTSGQLWIWASVLVVIVVIGTMSVMAAERLAALRWQIGAKNTRSEKQLEARLGPAGAGVAQFTALRDAWNPWPVAIVGVVGFGLLLWLMLVRPF